MPVLERKVKPKPDAARVFKRMTDDMPRNRTKHARVVPALDKPDQFRQRPTHTERAFDNRAKQFLFIPKEPKNMRLAHPAPFGDAFSRRPEKPLIGKNIKRGVQNLVVSLVWGEFFSFSLHLSFYQLSE
jgi:hypothetical protein